ncbi:MAG: cation transporter [Candidatus Omnitrophica bacterium]|nr:cation transporter [Candidatus Omnitrophota bacterium]
MRIVISVVLVIVIFSCMACFAKSSVNGETINVTLKGLVCDFCARAIEKTFAKQADVEKVDVDLDSALLVVEMKPGKTMDDGTVARLVAEAGYEVESVRR